MGNKLTMDKIIKTTDDRELWQPFLLKNIKAWYKILTKNKLSTAGVEIIHETESQLEELYQLRNPKTRFQGEFKKEATMFAQIYLPQIKWFYFPWLKKIVSFLPEKMHNELRTGRNRNLITAKEQEKFYNSHVAILGMSVGSHVALTITLTGGSKFLSLADPDRISGSNINRIRTGFYNLGINKTKAVARQIFEINPYSKIKIYPEGINDSNLKKLLTNKIDLLIEETDSPYLKLKVREMAKPLGIPVIMAADNADGIIVDVERYDQNKKLPILHGILGKMTSEQFKLIAPRNLPKTMAKIAGAHLSTVRMLESVLEVGNTIYSWPQLGSAATLCGSVLANIARKILLNQPIKSGRFDINIDTFLVGKENKKTKKQKNVLLKKIGAI